VPRQQAESASNSASQVALDLLRRLNDGAVVAPAEALTNVCFGKFSPCW
jgi:hypothetical protein